MSDIAKNCRSKPVEPSISSLVRTFAPSSSTVDRGSSLPSDTHDTKLRVNPAKISDVLSGNALAVLKDVAEMFDSVPYIKAAAGFVIWIFEIRDELSDLGDKWEEFEKKLNGVVKILRNVRRDHENFKSEANLPEDLKQDLYDMATFDTM
ncbi:hypothetical protein DENSPDRAFT_884490 [Dentipellis sp. KUC8613]|nr:hypothetical protein DENSPDRAFT_884490 [Dentipellis sp. KUC8613]